MTEPMNPYAPPQATLASQAVVERIFLDASLGTRFVNFFVDAILRSVIGVGTAFLCSSMGLPTLGSVFMLLSLPGYYIVFEGAFGRTPAKFMTRTLVTTVTGARPTLGQILGRSVLRFVPFEPFSFLGSSPTGWHDRWSGTRVVYGSRPNDPEPRMA